MPRKDHIDAPGAAALVLFSFLMCIDQVMVKLVNEGLAPVFQAGARSAAALLPLLLVAVLLRRRLSVTDGSFWPGMLCGLLFAIEFLLLFLGIERTAVSRASVLFYTMPVWVALAAHWLIPGERLTRRRVLGLALAVTGVAVALIDEVPELGPESLTGDLLCLAGAVCWAGIALTARLTRFSRAAPEMQLLYQLAVSGPLLMLLAPAFGPVVREMTWPLAGIFAFQVLAVVTFGMLLWFTVLRVYPASDMTAFSFLAPLFGVIGSWFILDEPVTASLLVALGLVGTGIVLISWRRAAPRPVPSTAAPPDRADIP